MTDTADDDLVEMTDDEEAAFVAALADPATIATHERAMEIAEVLEREIADITAQIEAYQIAATMAPPTPARREWAERALFARAIKRQQIDKVLRRDRELRGIPKGPAQTPGKDREFGLAKHARLQAEAEARKAAKQAEIAKATAQAAEMKARAEDVKAAVRKLEIARLNGKYRLFVDAAKALLPPDQFRAVWDEVERRQSTLGEAAGAR